MLPDPDAADPEQAATGEEIEHIEEGCAEATITLLQRLAAALKADVRISSADDLGLVEFEAHAA